MNFVQVRTHNVRSDKVCKELDPLQPYICQQSMARNSAGRWRLGQILRGTVSRTPSHTRVVPYQWGSLNMTLIPLDYTYPARSQHTRLGLAVMQSDLLHMQSMNLLRQLQVRVRNDLQDMQCSCESQVLVHIDLPRMVHNSRLQISPKMYHEGTGRS